MMIKLPFFSENQIVYYDDHIDKGDDNDDALFVMLVITVMVLVYYGDNGDGNYVDNGSDGDDGNGDGNDVDNNS